MLKLDGNEIKLVVSDVDGTLVSMGDKNIQQKTIDVLKQITDDGVFFALDTGNLHNMLKWMIEKIHNPIIDQTRYFIGNSGLVLHDYLNDETFVEGILTGDQSAKIVEIFLKHNSPLSFTDITLHNVYHTFKSDVDRMNKQNHDRGIEGITNILIDPDNIPHIATPKMMFNAASNEMFTTLIDEIDLALGDSVAAQSWQKNGADIVATGFNKFTGLLALIDLINERHNQNITLDNVLFFGDNYNDLSVFENHKYTIAMANAIDEIKANAFDITDSSSDEGVANFLLKIMQ